MLVLKFIKQNNVGRQIDVGLSCATYEVTHCDGGCFIVTAYKTLTHDDGVEYRLSLDGDPNDYKMCFVINEQGKTVDTYKAFKSEDTAVK